jgi:hypothetical protein
MRQIFPLKYRAAQYLLLFALSATLALAQSGDISGSLGNFTTLFQHVITIIRVIVGIVLFGGLMLGSVTLSTNRPRGAAMIAGCLVGCLLDGFAPAIVSTLTGGSVNG